VIYCNPYYVHTTVKVFPYDDILINSDSTLADTKYLIIYLSDKVLLCLTTRMIINGRYNICISTPHHKQRENDQDNPANDLVAP